MRAHVFLNRNDLGYLHVSHWTRDTLRVPIEALNFAERGYYGAKARVGHNQLTIVPDEHFVCPGEFEVDWVSLNFSAAPPLILINGIHEHNSDWAPEFISEFAAKSVQASTDVDLTLDGRVETHANELRSQLLTAATEFGASTVHLVCHSQGGLDARYYLRAYATSDQPHITSVTFLSTPHGGSALADIIVDARHGHNPVTGDDDIERIAFWALWRYNTPQEPGLRDLMTYRARDLNAFFGTHLGITFYAFGADADLDGDRRITTDEARGIPGATLAWLWNSVYHMLGTTRSIDFNEHGEATPYWDGVHPATPTAGFRANDLAVTAESSGLTDRTVNGGVHYIETLAANHHTMESAYTARAIVLRLRDDFPATANPSPAEAPGR